MSGDAFGGLSGAAAAELHLKMSKKIAQLTKVIFHLNTRNEDFQMEFAHSSKVHTAQLQQLTQDAASKLRLLHEQLSTQTSATQQAERQAAKDKQQFQKDLAQYQHKVQAKQSASEQSFLLKITDLEDQVIKCERAFSERVQQLVRRAETQQQMSSLSASAVTDALKSAHERELEELRTKKNDEVTQLVTASNAKYNQMLAEQLRVQDALRDENARAKALLEQQLQLTKHELSGELVAQEKAAKEVFDQMKHQLVGKIENLLADTEQLRGHEAKLRQEKEALLQAQSELQRQLKQLELQVTKAQHESQSVRKDADASAQNLQQMLTAGTEKIDQLAQELDALKKALQTRDQALRQAQKDLEAAQMETLQRNMSLSEKDAASHQQLQEKELQIANLKAEMQMTSQQKALTEANLHKQIQALEAQLAVNEKALSELGARLANSELQRTQVQKEKEKALLDVKTENEAHVYAIQEFKQSQEKQLQELLTSHSKALELQKNEMETKLRDLETHLKQNTSESLEKTIAQLKSEHLKALIDQKTESDAALAKAKQELLKAETQFETLQGNLAGKEKELVDLRLKLVELTVQLKKSQDQVTNLQLEKDEKLKAAEKSRKEIEDALQKQIKELNIQKDSAVKKLSAERDQLQLQHSQILMALTKDYEAKQNKLQNEWEKDKHTQLTSQTTQLSERYELQMAAIKSELSLLQAELERVKQDAQETQRAMHETRLCEKECCRSSMLRHLGQLGAQAQRREDEVRLKMVAMLEQHAKELEALATRLNSENQQLLSKTQESAELRVAQLKATHRNEMEQRSQQHALASKELREGLENARQRDLLVLRTENTQKLKELAVQKDRERVDALQEAQGRHDTSFGALQKQAELLQSALTQKTIDFNSSTCENERLNDALESKTREMADRIASLDRANREQIETLKKAAKQDMDRLLEENLAETKLLSDQFEETRRLMTDKVVFLKQTIAEWEDRYARRESRPEDVSRIADLERLVAEKDALVRRTLDEMVYFKRELLNREEMYNKTFARTPNVGVMNVLKPHVQLQAQMQNGVGGAGLSLGNNNNSSSNMAPQTKRKTKPAKGAAQSGPDVQGGELHRRNSERTSSFSSGSRASGVKKSLPPLTNNQFVL